MIRFKTVAIAFTLVFFLPWAMSASAQLLSKERNWLLCEPDNLAGVVTKNTGATPQNAPLQISADSGQSSEREARLQGNVQAQQGDQRLEADSVYLDRAANRLSAEGGVTYGNPGIGLRSNQAEWDLQKEQGIFKDIQYYLPSRSAQGQAEQINIDINSKQSRLRQASFSTCHRGAEFWQLRSRRLNIDENTGRGVARDVTLAFSGVPVLYLPYLSFPINDQRQSGFLTPTAGYESGNGLDLRIPYYWNIAPNQDMTLAPRLLANRGLLLGGEYRFLQPRQRGEIRLEYIPKDQVFGADRSAVDIRHQSNPLPNVSTDLLYEHVSDQDYLEDLSNNVGLLQTSYLEQHFTTSYAGSGWVASALAQRFQTLDKVLFPPGGEPYNRLPQVLFDGNWLQHNSGLSYTLRSEAVRFARDRGVTGTRFDLQPGISLPMEWTAAFLTPRLSYRYTAYNLNNEQPSIDSNPVRSAPVASLDSGLFFERPVQWRWWGNRADILTLEPRLFYLYVPFRNQTDIPNFDSATVDAGYPWLFLENRFTGTDRLGDANQITTALTSRLINSTSGRELLRASIGHIHYFRDPQVSLGPGIPEAVSAPGIIAEGLVYLRSDLYARGALEWDDRQGSTRRSALDLRYDPGGGRFFNASYRLARDALEQLDFAILWPLSERWQTVARWNYSIRDRRNIDTLAGFEYRQCCWAFRLLARQSRARPEDEDVKNSVFFELELTGLSSIGTNINSLVEEAVLGRDVDTQRVGRARY